MAVAKPVGNGNTDNCGDAGQGTSFACPLISGVAAMVLEANPNLTWRDVQGVLAATTQTDFNDEDDETGQWTTNQAGVKHSYTYGFGLVDALAAVTAATGATWQWRVRSRTASPIIAPTPARAPRSRPLWSPESLL